MAPKEMAFKRFTSGTTFLFFILLFVRNDCGSEHEKSDNRTMQNYSSKLGHLDAPQNLLFETKIGHWFLSEICSENKIRILSKFEKEKIASDQIEDDGTINYLQKNSCDILYNINAKNSCIDENLVYEIKGKLHKVAIATRSLIFDHIKSILQNEILVFKREKFIFDANANSEANRFFTLNLSNKTDKKGFVKWTDFLTIHKKLVALLNNLLMVFQNEDLTAKFFHTTKNLHAEKELPESKRITRKKLTPSDLQTPGSQKVGEKLSAKGRRHFLQFFKNDVAKTRKKRANGQWMVRYEAFIRTILLTLVIVGVLIIVATAAMHPTNGSLLFGLSKIYFFKLIFCGEH